MKKIKLGTTAILLGLFAILLLLILLTPDPNRPSFQPFQNQPTIDPYKDISYEFLSSAPFEGGLMWISIWSTNSHHAYLYDVEHHLIRGELLRAGPVFLNHDQTKVLCLTRAPSTRTFRGKLSRFIENITSHKINFPGDDVETYWVIDLQKNSATRIGELSQTQGAGSDFEPSPDFRYGFNQPTTTRGKPEMFICDLQEKNLSKHIISGEPVGWWDAQQIVMQDSADNFNLYNVETRQTKNFLSNAEILKFLNDSGVPPATTRISAFHQWTGRENQFFITETSKRWQAAESYLIKLEYPTGTLKLLDPKFKFEWSDHFHPSMKYYVYSGRESGHTNDAVYLRDLATGTNHTLVPTISAKEFSIPNFYKNTVIYVRSNMLWQTDLTGTNTTRLFPPPGPMLQPK